jgi:hypothetical protein
MKGLLTATVLHENALLRFSEGNPSKLACERSYGRRMFMLLIATASYILAMRGLALTKRQISG